MLGLGPQDRYWGVRALEFVNAVGTARTPETVMTLFEEAIGECGFHAYIVTELALGEVALSELILANGWPAEWSALYVQERLFRHDPVARHCFRTAEPFEWWEAPYDLASEPRAHAVMTRARDFRMNHGFCIPIHFQDGTSAAVSMATEHADLGTGVKPALHLMALYAHRHVRALMRPPVERHGRVLTAREREVVQWAAAGKTNWETGRILGISERTAKAHLQAAGRKLNAVGRTATVATALQLREI